VYVAFDNVLINEYYYYYYYYYFVDGLLYYTPFRPHSSISV